MFGYQRLPAPTLAGPPRYKWSLQFQYVVSAPEQLASRVSPIARRVFGSRRATPRWEAAAQAHIRRQQGRARQDDAQIMAAIRENGRRSSEALDSGMSSWRRREAMRDRGQERSIDGIRERRLGVGPVGGRVKLPSAYDNAYETPRGDWVVSEAPLDDVYLTPLEAE